MGSMPRTHYAKAADGAHIAYQVVGDADLDLVMIPPWITHLELGWENPGFAAIYTRLSAFTRLILLDKRGTGLSDPVSSSALPPLEQRMDDVHAVLDAVGSERAAFVVMSEGGPMTLLFAATYPERTQALVLLGCWAKGIRSPDYPYGWDQEEFNGLIRRVEEEWGQGIVAELLTPTLAGVPEVVEGVARLERYAATPGTAGALLRMAFEGDVRQVLPAVKVPTLVLHRAEDAFVVPEHGRYLAENIPRARLVELPGENHFPYLDLADRIADEIELFLTGERPIPPSDRQLATVLFTDIVDSTGHAAAMGDRPWRELLDLHADVVRRQLERFSGREVKDTGDGFLATFDGPARAIRCACAIRDGVHRLGVEVRAGLHTGEIEIRDQDIGGIAVHIGQRVSGRARPGEVLVSRTVVDLVAGSGINFESQGEQELKGVEGTWCLFAVKD